ncbi:MAG: NAD(P)/FAD-dependent oxidoreductase [Acetobacteraceae bacterium]
MTPTHVIVGAGQAGAWAAVTMRQVGFTGRIVLIGEEPWRPYERPPLSKALLTQEPAPPVLFFHDESAYREQAIELLLETTVEQIDPVAHLVSLGDGRTLGYDRLLLTTGGRARPLLLPGGDQAVLLRTLDDARRLRGRLESARDVVCVGAGVIGLEIASSAAARGCRVTVLEAAARPMGRSVSPEGARFVEALHRRAGVELHFNVAIEAIEARPNGSVRVICGGGDAFAADLVVAGIGMVRNLDLAVRAGLEIDGGVVVNEFGQTSAPDVYAAGDIAAFLHPFYARRLRLESWRHAQNHGIAVARSMCAEATAYDDIPWFWTEQHGVNLQVTGLPAEAARTIVRVEDPPNFVAIHLADDDTVVGVTAANAPREVRAGTALIRSRRPIDPVLLADPGLPLQRLLSR